jgi:hypothetical protein
VFYDCFYFNGVRVALSDCIGVETAQARRGVARRGAACGGAQGLSR